MLTELLAFLDELLSYLESVRVGHVNTGHGSPCGLLARLRRAHAAWRQRASWRALDAFAKTRSAAKWLICPP
jgi:hypothetical protein